MKKQYYTLLTRDTKDAPWQPQFGSYDKQDVIDEREDYTNNYDLLRINTFIIKTGDRQADIDLKVAELNAAK